MVVSTLFQGWALTLYQRCVTLKIRRRILFHFQRRINVISTLIHNVETTLIQRQNVGWVRPFSDGSFESVRMSGSSVLVTVFTLLVFTKFLRKPRTGFQ